MMTEGKPMAERDECHDARSKSTAGQEAPSLPSLTVLQGPVDCAGTRPRVRHDGRSRQNST